MMSRVSPGGVLWLVAIAATMATIGIAGCGGDDDDSGPSTFESDTFPFTFEYPDGFEVTEDVSISQELGGAVDETVGIAMDDDNGLFLQRVTLNLEIDESNLNLARAEFDRLIQQVDPGAAAEEGETAGFPSLSYDSVAVPTPPEGESRLILLFEGDQEYVINCQSTPDGRDEIEEACDLAVETLAPTE
jgi:hypothetical protein